MRLWIIASLALAGEVHAQAVDLQLQIGATHLIDYPVRRAAIADGKILSASRVDGDMLLLLAEQTGSTEVRVWPRTGKSRLMRITVVDIDLDLLLGDVRELLGADSRIVARKIGRHIVLEGDAAAGDRRRAAAVAELHPQVVINLTAGQTWESMIHFEVRILEVRRNRLRELGIDWRTDINGPHAAIAADFGNNSLFRVVPAGEPHAASVDSVPAGSRIWPAATSAGWVSSIDSRIRFLEQQGDAYVLAEPNLSCRSGGNARFVSGGEIPIPVIDDRGSTDVEFHEYGVILDVTPTLLGGSRIHTRIDTEVSEIDESQRVLGVPGLLKRRTATDVNLQIGQTLVIAGLISQTRADSRSGLPVLHRAPLIGGLFRSRQRRGVDTELAILITPHLASAEAAPDAARDLQQELLERATRARERGEAQ
ncbi:MAG: pilus assembly protein N-terminal domain-containing protein [Steroidobacteraceae bacterium]